MTPQSAYEQYLASGQIKNDPLQQQAIRMFEVLYHSLIKRQSWLARRFSLPIKGIYIWGGVGRGKTFLMDLFYHAIPFEQKIRIHFHRFMQMVHHELSQKQGEPDPLAKIAYALAKKYRLFCLDEFHVLDIADAMILARLLQCLFERGVVLVATSNTEPNHLYYNGLQRDKFLPTIDLIYEHMDIFSMIGGNDYRLAYLSCEKCYHFPLNVQTELELERVFTHLTLDQQVSMEPIEIAQRMLPIKQRGENTIWFTFEALCEGARATEDYIEIAELFDTVIVSGVKQMGSEQEASAKRFMHMVDVFYEKRVALLISAEVAIDDLYVGKLISVAFQRTKSRLFEMQSEDYLSQST